MPLAEFATPGQGSKALPVIRDLCQVLEGQAGGAEGRIPQPHPSQAQSPGVEGPQCHLRDNSSTQLGGPLSPTGLVFMPGTTQLTAKDILYRLQASKAKCVVASEEVIPAVEAIASECPHLKTKLQVSPHSRQGWLSLQELLQ